MDQSTIFHRTPSSTPTPSAHSYGTRKRQNSTIRPSARVRDTSSPFSAHTPALQPRRIRPLAAVMPNTTNTVRRADSPSTSLLKDSKPAPKDKQLARRLSNALNIEFPPKHVVLHPDDATNKVFIAVGRAFMSVDNCAMTVKDLAELTLSTGLQCQNVSAAAQAITFFIRSHLQRCEVEQDCPLLLRLVLSGSARDDVLVPALYSRSGGNVSKDKLAAKDENGKETQSERLTCFRRGTTVWYLSKAAGAPCPFARNGISLRDFSGESAFAGPESRKRDGQSGDSCRGMKRKRERDGLRRRPGRTSINKDSDDEEEEEEEGRRPMKVKLTLRLRPPCLSTMREKDEEASSSDLSSSGLDSDSDVDSDSEDEVMSVDDTPPLPTPDFRKDERAEDSSWTLPPYPIQRRISIPPYTPCEESYSSFYGSSYLHSTHAYIPSSPECSRSRPVMDVPSCSNYRREPSVPLSVASPPPDSDAEDDVFRFSSSPSRELDEDDLFSPVAVKTEEDAQTWPQDVSRKAVVKSEPSAEYDFATFDPLGEIDVKLEDLDFNSLSLAWNGSHTDLAAETRLSVDLGVKQEEEDAHQDGSGQTWEQSEPVMISPSIELQQCPFKSHALARERDHGSALLWTDVELLGPENVQPDEFEGGEWASPSTSTASEPLSSLMSAHSGSSSGAYSRSSSVNLMPSGSCIQSRSSSPYSMSPLSVFSARPPSLSGSVQTWSSPELERVSLEPSSLAYGPDLPSPSYSDHQDENNVMDAVSEEQELTQKATPRQKVDSLELCNADEELFPSSIASSVSRNGTIRQIKRPTVSTVVDVPVEEGSTPWERGMISLCDVEEHLLPSAHSFDLPVSRIPPMQQSLTEDAAIKKEAPLSPQEEEMFQSLFQCPAWELNSPSEASMRAQLQSVVRDRNAKENCAVVEVAEASEECDENSVERKEKTSSRPLRRSLRVAKAAASRTVKERLRKRTSAP